MRAFPRNFDEDAADLVDKLLKQSEGERIGVGADGIQRIRRHAFFKNFCYATANVWFAFYSAHSSQAQFPTAAIATFNVLWTSLPTIAHACFDQVSISH